MNARQYPLSHGIPPHYRWPCLFGNRWLDERVRKKRRPYKRVQTPYEKLKSVPDAQRYLKPGVSFIQLDAQAARMSDNEAGRQSQDARAKLCNETARQQRMHG